MEVTLSIASDRLSSEALHDVTLDLSRTLNREADVRATLSEGAADPGAKGDAVALGSILIELGTHTAWAFVGHMLLTILMAFFERDPSLRFTLAHKNGATLTLGSESVQRDSLQHTKERTEMFLRSSQ